MIFVSLSNSQKVVMRAELPCKVVVFPCSVIDSCSVTLNTQWLSLSPKCVLNVSNCIFVSTRPMDFMQYSTKSRIFT